MAKKEPAPTPSGDKTPHERFTELGAKLMRVSRAEVAELERRWPARNRQRKGHHNADR